MPDRKQELLHELERCVLEMEDEAVVSAAESYVDGGYDAYDGITQGLSKGMEKPVSSMRKRSILSLSCSSAPTPCTMAWRSCAPI